MTVVNKALEVRGLRDENRQLKEELGRRYEFDNIIGRSPPMQEIFAAILRVAPTRATVLLAGESGVGKDLIARAIHFHSPRRDRPLVKINCTAMPENLMESELFGYEKGAFTGANDFQARQVRAGRYRHGVPGRNRRRAGARSRSSCCACCRSASSSAWAATRPSTSMSA